MPVEISNGTVAVTTVSIGGFVGSALTGSTADSIIAKINNELVFDGLTITHYDVTSSGIFFPITGQFSATLQILNQSGQELDDLDLQAQLNDAVTTVGGYVSASAVVQVVGTPGGVNTGTGSMGTTTQTTAAGAAQQTTAPGSSAHQCGDPSWAWYTDVPKALECLTSKGLSTIGLLAIGLLVGIVLIVGGQKTGRVRV